MTDDLTKLNMDDYGFAKLAQLVEEARLRAL